MSFDGLFTHAIVHELDQKLTTGRVKGYNSQQQNILKNKY